MEDSGLWGQFEELDSDEEKNQQVENDDEEEDINNHFMLERGRNENKNIQLSHNTVIPNVLSSAAINVVEDITASHPTIPKHVKRDSGRLAGSASFNLLKKHDTRSPISNAGAKNKHSSSPMNRNLLTRTQLVRAVTPSPSCPNFGSLQAAQARVASSGLTISEAKGELWKLRESGILLKKGFRHRKKWMPRHMVLAGRRLKYFENSWDETTDRCRGCLELTKHSLVVEVNQIQNPNERDTQYYAFNIIPNAQEQNPTDNNTATHTSSISSGAALEKTSSIIKKQDLHNHRKAKSWFSWFSSDSKKSTDKSEKYSAGSILSTDNNANEIWRFQAKTAVQRKKWVAIINKSIALISRVDVSPSLSGVGTVHDHYDIKEVIGRGKFGVVRKGIAKQNEKVFAVKVINKAKHVCTPEDAALLRNEIRVMRKVTRDLDHSHICKLFQAYEDTYMVYLVMEDLSGGNLLERIERNKAFNESNASSVIYQILSALTELHEANIVLCDLRPETLLYSKETNTVKVVEFGKAIMLDQSTNINQHRRHHHHHHHHHHNKTPPQFSMQKPKGKPGFTAPEMITSNECTTACDIWSLGCIMFFMLMGYSPFYDSNEKVANEKVLKGLKPLLYELEIKGGRWLELSSGAKSLIERMLDNNRLKRITAKQMLLHEWVKNPPKPLKQKRKSKQNKRRSSSFIRTGNKAWSTSNLLALKTSASDGVDHSHQRSASAVNPFSDGQLHLPEKAVEDDEFYNTSNQFSDDDSDLNTDSNTDDFNTFTSSSEQFPPQAYNNFTLDGTQPSNSTASINTLLYTNNMNMEQRAQVFALDAQAEMVRAAKTTFKDDIDESGLSNNRNSSYMSLSTIGIGTGIGVRSTHQEDNKYCNTFVTDSGPFLSALETLLQTEAGISSDGTSPLHEPASAPIIRPLSTSITGATATLPLVSPRGGANGKRNAIVSTEPPKFAITATQADTTGYFNQNYVSGAETIIKVNTRGVSDRSLGSDQPLPFNDSSTSLESGAEHHNKTMQSRFHAYQSSSNTSPQHALQWETSYFARFKRLLADSLAISGVQLANVGSTAYKFEEINAGNKMPVTPEPMSNRR